MMKLMTVEVIFNALKEGRIKLTDEFRKRECLAQGRAPSGGSTMFAAINSRCRSRPLHGAIIQSGNACIALAEGISGSERSSPTTS